MYQRINIDIQLVSDLIKQQFPQFSHLPISEVDTSGWDNRTFHLGDEMLIRLPSRKCYASQVLREQQLLPYLQSQLTVQIPVPIGWGKASTLYPCDFSIYKWIDGKTLLSSDKYDLNQLAVDLANFIIQLQSITIKPNYQAGIDTFYRGASLSHYYTEAISAINECASYFNSDILIEIMDLAIMGTNHQDVWIHGDLAAGNILLHEGKLQAIIDFGNICTGDPACDYVAGWTIFDQTSRIIFRTQLSLDERSWNCARGWALWKAIITIVDQVKKNIDVDQQNINIIQTIIDEYQDTKST